MHRWAAGNQPDSIATNRGSGPRHAYQEKSKRRGGEPEKQRGSKPSSAGSCHCRGRVRPRLSAKSLRGSPGGFFLKLIAGGPAFGE